MQVAVPSEPLVYLELVVVQPELSAVESLARLAAVRLVWQVAVEHSLERSTQDPVVEHLRVRSTQALVAGRSEVRSVRDLVALLEHSLGHSGSALVV